jgi:hypothetical protein
VTMATRVLCVRGAVVLAHWVRCASDAPSLPSTPLIGCEVPNWTLSSNDKPPLLLQHRLPLGALLRSSRAAVVPNDWSRCTLGYRVVGVGFRVQGLEFRVQGSGVKISG